MRERGSMEEHDDGWRGWLGLENCFYRRFVMCEGAEWPENVVESWWSCLRSVARGGGPVVLCGGTGWRLGMGLEIFNGCGRRILPEGTLKLGGGVNRVLAMGWNGEDVLIIVQSNGRVTRFGLDGRLVDEWSLPEEEVLYDATVTEDGQAVMRTVEGKLWVVGGEGGGQRAVCLVQDSRLQPPKRTASSSHGLSTMAATADSEDGSISVFLTCTGGMLGKAVPSEVSVSSLQATLEHLTPSPSGTLLAASLPEGDVMVVTTEHLDVVARSRPYEEVSTDGKRRLPRQLAWCGNHAVAALYDNTLVLIGPRGGCVSWSLSTPTFLATEFDGLRLLSTSSIEFVELVPREIHRIFALGSTDAAALLYDSVKVQNDGGTVPFEGVSSTNVEDHSLKKYSAVELLLDDKSIVEAAECCALAAKLEWSLTYQQSLLRAASYGFSFADFDNSNGSKPRDRNLLASVATTLRVLNSARNPAVGVLATIKQMETLTVQKLIDRISALGHDMLALRLVSYCRLGRRQYPSGTHHGLFTLHHHVVFIPSALVPQTHTNYRPNRPCHVHRSSLTFLFQF